MIIMTAAERQRRTDIGQRFVAEMTIDLGASIPPQMSARHRDYNVVVHAVDALLLGTVLDDARDMAEAVGRGVGRLIGQMEDEAVRAELMEKLAGGARQGAAEVAAATRPVGRA